MCGICGIAFQKGHRIENGKEIREIFSNLLVETQRRGRTSAGVCVTTYSGMEVIKKKMSAFELTETPDYRAFMEKFVLPENEPIYSIIGHCRTPTKGSPDDNHNNHPVVSGDTVGVHNGGIRNDEELWKMAGNRVKRVGMVDTEIIFAIIEHLVSNKMKSMKFALRKAHALLEGSYACAVVNRHHPYALHLFRNHMPIEIVRFPRYGVILFASQMSFIRDAITNFDLGPFEEIKIPADSAIGFNLAHNKYQPFKLKLGGTGTDAKDYMTA
jgi:glucosamine 6-phosphate synthetase-like amidotransferase/phosphosugar isomerase protein